MSVRITDNTPKIRIDTQHKSNLFVRFFMDEVDRFAQPLTPKKEGELRRGTLKVVTPFTNHSRGRMVWLKEYAGVQERGFIKGRPILNYTTPGTGPKYAERSVKLATLMADSLFKRVGLFR